MNVSEMTLFRSFLLCVLFTCSFASTAKYNEAMCILYKQQMQQYSDNKSSRSYRNAKRDFDKNCGSPPVEQKSEQTIAAPISRPEELQTPVLTDDTLDNAEQPVSANAPPVNDTVNPLDVSETSSPINNVNISPSAQAVKDTNKVVANPPVTINDSASQTQAPTPVTMQVKEPQIQANTANELSKLRVVTPIAPPATQSTSLTPPLLIMLLVLLIAGLVMYKLRIKKNAANESVQATDSVESNATSDTLQTVSEIPPMAVKERTPSNLNAQANAKQRHTQNITDEVQQTRQPIEAGRNQTPNPVDTLLPETSPNQGQPSLDAPLVTEPQSKPNTAVINQESEQPLPLNSSLNTLNNLHDFKEPEIRTFNPDAPLSEKSTTQSILEERDTQQATRSKVEAVPVHQENLTPPAEQDGDKSKVDTISAQRKANDVAQQPEHLSAEESQLEDALNALNVEIDAQQNEPDETDADNKVNPFANLSLDPTWDPNTKEKPTIEPKKVQPKSAQLIAAEERAKQLKTDD